MNEETFVRELGRRAEHVEAAPLTFDSVRGRAVRIRRRRRATTAVAVAAVVAIVSAPFALSGGADESAPDPAPSPPVAPGASVLHDGVLTLPDGHTVDLDVDNADVAQLGVLTDGRIVLAMIEPYAVRVYTADGRLEAEFGAQLNSITTSATDDAVAWISEDFRTRVLRSGVDGSRAMHGVPMPGESPGSIDAVLSPRHLLVGDFTTTSGEVTPLGYEQRPFSEPLRVTDVSPDGSLWAVQYADDADPQFGCSGLYDPEAEEMVARSCDTANLRFSPDGQHLLGMRGDNNMYGDVATYDLQLEEVGRFDSSGEGHVVSRAAWADPDHLLVAESNWRDSTWSLVRVGLDWTEQEDVVPAGPGANPELTAEYLLSE